MAPGCYNQSYLHINTNVNLYNSSSSRYLVTASPPREANMDPKKPIPPRKPMTAKETHETLQDLGFTNPLRTVNNNTRDDGELISSMTPTDANVGKSTSIRESITAAMSSMHQSKSKAKRSASNELLKIDNLDTYQQACAEYKWALKEGWSKERLLDLVDDWQRIDERGGREG
ncbi:hypothetical protein PTT_11347 [Pyrenophora teres f. teres 0-1]|uniref:Uncharacterized protein n=1 Tax=Pyrenophora teres f. teres (strain 0-1) TaxID=861557 RepID=E3RRC4_PYRTT|nr:hypothetical protein PTT_11347 [Pyrenophora teres f. teres 0-1]